MRGESVKVDNFCQDEYSKLREKFHQVYHAPRNVQAAEQEGGDDDNGGDDAGDDGDDE